MLFPCTIKEYLTTMGAFFIGVVIDLSAIFRNRFEKKNRDAVTTQLRPLTRVFIVIAVIALFEFLYFGNFTLSGIFGTGESMKPPGFITSPIDTVKRLIGE